MDKKIKLIVIILGIGLAAMGFIAFQSIQSSKAEKNRYEAEIKKVIQDRDSLTALLNQAKTDLKGAQSKLDTMQKEIGGVSSERDDLKERYEAALKQKEELMEKITKLEAERKAQPKVEAASVASEDSYWGSVLKDKTGLEIEVGGLKQQLESMNIKTEELSKQNNDLTLELNKINQMRADLERQIAYSEKLSKALSEELVREKNDKKVLTEQFDKIKQDYSVLQQQLRDETAEKIKLSKQMQDLKADKQVLARKIAELDQVLEDRMTDIVGIKDQLTAMRSDTSRPSKEGSKVVELPPIVVQGGDTGGYTDRSRLSGSILAVNKENNFVVVDIGESVGAKTGMIFYVYRNELQIASVEVIQVRRDISAADIKSTEPGQQVKVGDLVKSR
ncbi:MAG: hypothetical protein Q8L26_04725 [Candidatus Omnitrophota bacterium]|nr:hypothetical protein [Candidatus Omnitrophota bacterium]